MAGQMTSKHINLAHYHVTYLGVEVVKEVELLENVRAVELARLATDRPREKLQIPELEADKSVRDLNVLRGVKLPLCHPGVLREKKELRSAAEESCLLSLLARLVTLAAAARQALATASTAER